MTAAPLAQRTAARSAARLAGACACACALSVSLAPTHGAPPPAPAPLPARVILVPVAMTGTDGELGPQLGPGVTFSRFTEPRINSGGTVAFGAGLSGEGVTVQTNGGIWRADAAPPSPVMRTGTDGALGPQVAPGVTFSGIPYYGRLYLGLGDDGTIVFPNSLVGVAASDPRSRLGLWRVSAGAPSPVALTNTDGDFGPNIGLGRIFAGDSIGLVGVVSVGDHGEVAFTNGVVSPEHGSSGIWRVDDASPVAIMSTEPGSPAYSAPGVDGGFGMVETAYWQANDRHGRVSFAALAIDSTGFHHRGIWSAAPGKPPVLRVLRGSDGPAGPGLGPGVVFGLIRSRNYLSVNDAGALAFSVDMGGELPPSLGDGKSIWLVEQDGRRPVAAGKTDGSLGPGLGPGVTFRTFKIPLVGGDGDVVFRAEVTGDELYESGIWVARAGELRPIMVSGVSGVLGPGLGAGGVFANQTSVFDGIAINSRGEIAFGASASVPGSMTEGGGGVWVFNGSRTLLIVIRGRAVDLDPTSDVDVRTVASVSLVSYDGGIGGIVRPLSGGQDGRPTILSDTGEVALLLEFTDHSSGIFKARYHDSCPGDLTGDSLIDGADLSALLSAFGTADSLTDLNADGVVNTADLGLLLNRFGSACEPE